jgi:DNA-binding HxlR family transcriptional regulator
MVLPQPIAMCSGRCDRVSAQSGAGSIRHRLGSVASILRGARPLRFTSAPRYNQGMTRPCSVAMTLEQIGERWALLVLREVLLGVRRFEYIQENTGAPRAVLSRRLRKLTEAGVIEHRDYRDDGSRTRQEYVATQAGRELQPVLTALMQWGDKYLASSPPLSLVHQGCGASVRATLRCEAGHGIDDAGHGLNAVQHLAPREPIREA